MQGFMVVIRHQGRWTLQVDKVPYENDIHQYYRELKCEVFDIVQANVYTPYLTNDSQMLIVVDDNGKLLDKYPTLPVFHPETHEVCDLLVGDVGFVHRDEMIPSEIRGLTEQEADELIKQFTFWMMTRTKFKVTE